MKRVLMSLTTMLMGCSVLAPEPTLEITGTIRSTGGMVIEGALIKLQFHAAFSPTTSLIGLRTTDAAGAFHFDVGPPPGYEFPNCATMRLLAEAHGHWPSGEVSFGSGSCDGVSAVEGIQIVLEAHEPLVITTTTLPPAIPTVPYDELLQAIGGGFTYTWSVSSGSLPSGLNLLPEGFIIGTTTESGTANFTVHLADGAGQTAEQALSLTAIEGDALQPTESCSDYPDTAIATFEDSKLRDAVRVAVGVAPHEPLTCALVEAITVFDASYQAVVNLNLIGLESIVGIQNLMNLTVLDLSGNRLVGDIRPLGPHQA